MIKDILLTLRDVKSVTISTVTSENKPRARIIDIMKVSDKKLYFITARGKEFYQQLLQNNNIAITCYTYDYKMIRLNCVAEKSNDVGLEEIFTLNPMLNDIYPGSTKECLEVFKVDKGFGEIFNLAQSPLKREEFSLGEDDKQFKKYHINNNCIECGICVDVCPENCISKASPYFIKQENCVKCGSCAENCPVETITFS